MIEVAYFVVPLALIEIVFYAVLNIFGKYYTLGAPYAHADLGDLAIRLSSYPLADSEA